MKGPLSSLFSEGKYLIQNIAHLLPKNHKEILHTNIKFWKGEKKIPSAHSIGWIKQFFLAQCCSI